MNEARRPKINDFDLALRVRLDKDVLWFQIAMDQIQVMNKVQGIQNLLCNFLKPRNVEVMLLLNLSVVLGVLVKVVSQKFSDNYKMLLVVKVVNDLEQVLGIEVIAVGLDESQELDLIDRLIEVVLVVLNNLHADHLLCMDIVTLDSL